MSGGGFHQSRPPSWLWWAVIITGVLTLIIGGTGVLIYENHHVERPFNETVLAFDSIYHATQMLILHTPDFEFGPNIWIEIGCWLGAFTLIATTSMFIWKRFWHEVRLMRLSGWTGHHVVCGLGQKGMDQVRFQKRKDRKAKIVVIDPKADDHSIDQFAPLGVCVLEKDAAGPGALHQARVDLAREVIVITGEDETNMRIAAEVRKICDDNKGCMTQCFVHLSDIHLRERLQSLGASEPGKTGGCTLTFFDVFDQEARRVLASLPLDGAGIPEGDPRTVHVVIVGMGRMGRSVAMRAAKMGHFANGKPLRLSVVCRDSDQRLQRFLFRYPVLARKGAGPPEICDLTFHEAEAESLRARELITGWAAEPDTVLHLFICVDENSRAIEIGLRLQEMLVQRPDCNLLVRIKTRASMAELLHADRKTAPHIRIFGTVEDGSCEEAMRHQYREDLAKAIHKDFVHRREADSSRTAENDPAMKEWKFLREDFRESNRQQADHIPIKVRAIGCEAVEMSDPRDAVTKFGDAEIEIMAKMEHERWKAERLLGGWRYGPPGKKEQRISEHLGPWEPLDESIKKYDRQSAINIPDILKASSPAMKVVRQKV
jgi:hypothetical protein